MKTTLVIMAAGLGSRYGGNKQVFVMQFAAAKKSGTLPNPAE